MNVPLVHLAAELEGLRIAHVSDLHLRRWSRGAQRLQNALQATGYDLLIVTGDFGHVPSAHERTAELVRRLLAPLRPALGVYGVLGNHDAPELAEHALPLTLLRDEVRLVSVQGGEFYLGGVEQTEVGRRPLDAALSPIPLDAPLILMAHYPSTIREAPPGADLLMLAGHTHGGQIRIPGVGCLWPNDGVPRAMAQGLHRVQGNWLHVSAGTGVSGPLPVRLHCPPEITILTLRRRVRIRRKRAQGAAACVSATA